MSLNYRYIESDAQRAPPANYPHQEYFDVGHSSFSNDDGRAYVSQRVARTGVRHMKGGNTNIRAGDVYKQDEYVLLASSVTPERQPLPRSPCQLCEEGNLVMCTADEPCCAHGNCNETCQSAEPSSSAQPPTAGGGYFPQQYPAEEDTQRANVNIQNEYRESEDFNNSKEYAEVDYSDQSSWTSEEHIYESNAQPTYIRYDSQNDENYSGDFRNSSYTSGHIFSQTELKDCVLCKDNVTVQVTATQSCSRGRAFSSPPVLESSELRRAHKQSFSQDDITHGESRNSSRRHRLHRHNDMRTFGGKRDFTQHVNSQCEFGSGSCTKHVYHGSRGLCQRRHVCCKRYGHYEHHRGHRRHKHGEHREHVDHHGRYSHNQDYHELHSNVNRPFDHYRFAPHSNHESFTHFKSHNDFIRNICRGHGHCGSHGHCTGHLHHGHLRHGSFSQFGFYGQHRTHGYRGLHGHCRPNWYRGAHCHRGPHWLRGLHLYHGPHCHCRLHCHRGQHGHCGHLSPPGFRGRHNIYGFHGYFGPHHHHESCGFRGGSGPCDHRRFHVGFTPCGPHHGRHSGGHGKGSNKHFDIFGDRNGFHDSFGIPGDRAFNGHKGHYGYYGHQYCVHCNDSSVDFCKHGHRKCKSHEKHRNHCGGRKSSTDRREKRASERAEERDKSRENNIRSGEREKKQTGERNDERSGERSGDTEIESGEEGDEAETTEKVAEAAVVSPGSLREEAILSANAAM